MNQQHGNTQNKCKFSVNYLNLIALISYTMEQKVKDFNWDRIFGIAAYIIGIAAIIFTVIMIIWAVLR